MTHAIATHGSRRRMTASTAGFFFSILFSLGCGWLSPLFFHRAGTRRGNAFRINGVVLIHDPVPIVVIARMGVFLVSQLHGLVSGLAQPRHSFTDGITDVFLDESVRVS